MNRYRVQPRALAAIEDIHRYSLTQWDEERADAYVLGFFELFERIAARAVPWRPLPAEFEVASYRCRYQRHFVYWRTAADGSVIVFAVLHEKMLQVERVKGMRADDGDPPPDMR